MMMVGKRWKAGRKVRGVAKEDSNDDGGGMDGMDKTVDGKEVQDQQEEDEEEEEERSSEVVLA